MAWPVFIFFIPLSNLTGFTLSLIAFLLKFKSFKFLSFAVIASLGFLVCASLFTPFHGMEMAILLLVRYLLLASPLFLIPYFVFFFKDTFDTSKKILQLTRSVLFGAILLSLILIGSDCRTTYGGYCFLSERSSSIGTLCCILLSILSLNSFLNLDKYSNGIDKFLFLFSLIFFNILGALQGARIYYVFVILSGLPFLLHFIFTFARSSRLNKTAFKFIVLSFVTSLILIVCFQFVPFNVELSSLSRLISLFEPGSSDVRLSENFYLGGNIVKSVSYNNLTGNGAFSRLINLSTTSTYDSTLTLLLGDYGYVGLILISLPLFVSLRRLSSTIYGKYKMIATASELNMISLLLIYLVGSSSNEYIVLKSVNPMFAIVFALVFYSGRTKYLSLQLSM